mmetsp:Transcript_126303/g.178252  ORF Transcript_126303/g.178252 Transcript_126303/m.178252 type:complete len:214 (-) Transcript_126303:45-686(-)
MKLVLVLVCMLGFVAFVCAAPPAGSAAQGEVKELNSLDFRNIIGGPLRAVIDAQAASALATVDFITKVGMAKDGDDFKANMVSFDYEQPSGNGSDTTTNTVNVPFLTMLPLPYIEVTTFVLDFQVKLDSMTKTSADLTDTLQGDDPDSTVSVYGGSSFSMKTSLSAQENTQERGESQKAFSLSVRVEAANAQLPAGTQRIMDILEGAVRTEVL